MDVTKDLESLANLELPDKKDRWGRHIVKITILCFSILILACVAGLWVALQASLEREDSLNTSLACVRESSYEYDDAIGNAVKLLVDMDVPLHRALIAVGRQDHDGLVAALEEADVAVANVDEIKTKIDQAVTARRVAVEGC